MKKLSFTVVLIVMLTLVSSIFANQQEGVGLETQNESSLEGQPTLLSQKNHLDNTNESENSFNSVFLCFGFARPTFHNDNSSLFIEYSDINSLIAGNTIGGLGFVQSYTLFGLSGRSHDTLFEKYDNEIGEEGFRYDKFWGFQGDWGAAITLAKRKSMGLIGLVSAGVRIFDAYDLVEDSHLWLGQAYTRVAVRFYFSKIFSFTFGQNYNTGLTEYHSGVGATEFSFGFGVIQ